MAKVNRKVRIAPVITSVKDAQGETVSEIIKMEHEPRYKMIPVDNATHRDFLLLCEAHGFGRRGQGAYVRVVVRKELEAAKESGLLK